MSKKYTDKQVERICQQKGYFDWERCAATGRVTAWNPKYKKFVLVRK